MAMPSAMPPASSPTTVQICVLPWDATAISTTTTGRARPSLSPDSTLSSRRSRAGTSLRPMIAAANTGSVGERMAPTRKLGVQSSGVNALVSNEMPMNVSGMPRPSARPAVRPVAFRAGSAARMPSVYRMLNRARSASVTTTGSFGRTSIQFRPPLPVTAPTTRNSSAVESTVRAAKPEISTTTSSVTPKARIKDTARLTFGVGRTLIADQTSRHAAAQPKRCLGAPRSGLLDGVDLISERLILRPVSADHVATVMAGRRSPAWAPDFPDEGDRVIAGLLTRRGVPASGREQEFGQRLIIERSTELVVGGAGFFGPPDVDGRTELGYGIVPSRRGRGYATEAVLSLVRFGLADPDAVELFAGVELANPPSVADASRADQAVITTVRA